MSPGTLARARLLALLSFLLAALAAARVVLGPEPGFVLRVPDDAFYYLGIARSRIEHGVFSFDGGQTLTSGFHVLWMYLLLPLALLAGREDHLLLALATGLSAAIALGVALAALGALWWRRRTSGLLALAVSISSYAFLNGQVSAVEWPLCVATSAGLWALLVKAERGSRWLLLALFAVGIAGSLARSDFGGVPLAALAAALLLRLVARRPGFVTPSLAALAGAAVGLGLVLLHQHWISGSWVQGSARVKAIWGAAAGWSPAPVLHQFSRAVLYVPTLQNVGDMLGLKQRLGRSAMAAMLVVLPVAAALLLWKRRRVVEWARGFVRAGAGESPRAFLLLGALLTGAFYLALYSANPIGVQSWYTAHVWVPAFVLLALVFDSALGGASPVRRAGVEIAAVALVALNLTVCFRSPPVYARQAEMRRQGLLLRERVADGTLEGPVGWSDAGIVGFYEGGRVINLDGLVNDEIAGYLPDRLHCYLLAKRIRYLSSFGSAAEHYLRVPDLAGFTRPIRLRAADGFTIDLHEVDAEALEKRAECRPPGDRQASR